MDLAMEAMKKLTAIDRLACEMRDCGPPECAEFADAIFEILGWIGGHDQERDGI